jgi:Uncharacterized protein conserved in bacteria
MKTRARSRLDTDAAAPCLVAAILVALACSTAPSAAEPSFYAGKQITLIAGSGVGGGYDLLARLTARLLGRLIPGHPTIVVQNMPAAGSLVATNQIYNSAPKDGTVIALVQRGMLLAKLINPTACASSSRSSTGSEISTAKPAWCWPGIRRRIARPRPVRAGADRRRADRGRSGDHAAALQFAHRHQVQDRHRL